MSRSEAHVNVTCDCCGREVKMKLAYISHKDSKAGFDLTTWTEMYIDLDLETIGWTSKQGKDYCKDCAEEIENQND